MLTKYTNKTLAVHLFRISFGINFLFHGLVRLPNLKAFVTKVLEVFQNSPLPNVFITPIAYGIPFIELFIGAFLIINKFTRHTIVVTFGLMNLFIIGSSFAQRWELVGLQATYIGFLFLLYYFMDDEKLKH